jgi:hypothetical protein
MKNKTGRFVSAVSMTVALGMMSFGAQAGGLPYINGSVSFTGNAGLNAAISTATAFTNFSNVTAVAETNGSYAPLGHGTPATWTPFVFNPPTTPVTPLWTCSSNGVTYSFDATSMMVVFSSSNFLDIQGAGIAHITGYADTPGIWTIGVQQIGASVSFSASAMVGLPVLQCGLGSNKVFKMSWKALPGLSYQLQTTTNVSNPSGWYNTGVSTVATSNTATASYTNDLETGRFFRLQVMP